METQYKYVKELISTGTGAEGTLLIPRKIFSRLIPEVEKALLPRSEACMVLGPGDIPGSSVDINRVVPNTMLVRAIGEGANIVVDQHDFNTVNIKPLKYGVSLRITREMVEDSQFNILASQLEIAGRRFAENENTLIVTQLDLADNTISGGAAITIANIARGMEYLESTADYTATTFVVGYEVLNDLRQIDTFVEFSKLGTREMLEKGFVGTLYGMNVVKLSSNALGAGTAMTTTSAYIFDNRYAYALVEKRPITIENFELPAHDMSAVAITQRIAAQAIRTAAICKITTT